ncbi:amidophosphoribosyltransferase [bacterium]|nr:amidophosphoribosyltransferase [bacterium]
MSGIFGVVSKDSCAEPLFYGTDYHSHLGTAYGGLAVLGDTFERQIHDLSQSQFKSKFFEDIGRLKGNKGIGVVSDFDEQPIFINSKFGPFCIVTAGLIENSDELADKLFRKGISFSEVSHGRINMTELVAKLITQGKNLINGIERMFSVIEGSCSLLILNHEGVYAVRDRLGYTPLVLGQRHDAYAVATETSAFPTMGFEIIKYLGPGEICLINENGVIQKRRGKKETKICAFLWIYTGFPASTYEGINTETVRERCGRCLAQRDCDIDIDLVAGVPDSGMGHAIGYAMESKKPLRRPLVKYTAGYGRSYVPPSQDTRDLIARMKLIPIREIIENNRIAICEDSIVRGTQLKNYTIKKLWDAGAKEIHIRVACPPLMFPCRFNRTTRSTNELAARKAIRSIEGYDMENVDEYCNPDSDKYRLMVEWIVRNLEVTTLRYLTVDDIVSAIGLPREKLCLFCWTGKTA